VLNAAKFGSRPLLGCRAVKLPLGQCKTSRMQSEFSKWQNYVTGQQPIMLVLFHTATIKTYKMLILNKHTKTKPKPRLKPTELILHVCVCMWLWTAVIHNTA